jgi:Ala-tRNA(Pro) deacylase
MGTSSNDIIPDSNDFSRNPEKDVFDWLDSKNIHHRSVFHPPTHTVSDSAAITKDLTGAHTKNLFLKDKKGKLILVSAWAHSELRLNQLHKLIGTQRLSFAKPPLLWEALKVTPGSVSAFALIHDVEKNVRFFVDETLLEYKTINFHPLRNDMTTCVSMSDFNKFLDSTGRIMECINFADLSE